MNYSPKFLYHPVEAPEGRLLTSAAEEASLGTGWVDTPAKFGAVVTEQKTPKKSKKAAE